MQIVEQAGPRFGAIARWVVLIGVACLACFVALSTAYWQIRSTFAVPYWDQWPIISEYTKFTFGRLGLHQLIAQSNEHRILFPRLIMFVDLALFGGRNAFNVVAIDIFQIAHLALIVWMARHVLLTSFLGRIACVFIVAAMLTGEQYENIYWGFQSQFVMVYLFAAAAFACAICETRAVRWWPKTLWLCGCLGAGLVASFSMANGLLVWPLVLAILLLRKAGRASVAAVLVTAVLIAAVYAYHYVPVSTHTPATAFLHRPLEAASYLLTYLGNLVSPENIVGAKAAAVVLLVLLIGLAARQFTQPTEMDATAAFAWSSLLFVLMSGMLTTLGRFDFGDIQALSPRYITPVAMLWSAVAVLAVQVAGPRTAISLRLVCGLVLTGLTLWLGGVNQPVAEVRMAEHEAKMSAASTALIAGVDDEAALSHLGPSIEQILQGSALLRSQGLSLFGNREAGWMGRKLDQLFVIDPQPSCLGSFDVLRGIQSGGALAEGWAWTGPSAPPPADLVLTDASGTIVGVAKGRLRRPDVIAARPVVTDDRVGWRGYVSPAGRGTLSAYALEAVAPHVCFIGEKGGSDPSRPS